MTDGVLLMADVEIRTEGQVGRMTLNRPEALNALSDGMMYAIDDALKHWAEDSDVRLVLIDAAGDRAFCAGGDIAEIYRRTKAGDLAFGRDFWRDEYRMNARIAHYPKPYVAFMDGIVMGGGVGLSGHGSHRIVTERSMVAMPECAIGLIPDVGGTFLLSRAPGHIGDYLGLTGARMGPADAILAGFADVFVKVERLPELIEALVQEPDPAVIDRFADMPPAGDLANNRQVIDDVFGSEDVERVAVALEDLKGDDWGQKAGKAFGKGCPLSLHATLRLVREARTMTSLEEALVMEHRFTWRSLEQGDFIEGIRAAVIDKDRTPRWQSAALGDVGEDEVEAMLDSLNENEWTS